MQLKQPLTPTLSPAVGEREKNHAQWRDSLTWDRFQSSANGFPLPIRWGEGQGEGPQPLHGCG